MNLILNDIHIRNALPDDCAVLAAWWNDGEVMAHAGFPNGIGTTAEEVRTQIEHESDEGRTLIIEDGGRPIGEMNYRNVGEMTAEIGVKICESDYQGKGIGRTVLSMLVKELFSEGYSKIILDTNLNNLRAQHVYELLGFRKVAVNTDSWTDQLGKKQSSVDYELTPERFCDLSG